MCLGADSGEYVMKFTPSPATMVKLVNKEGKIVKVVPMNREQRRRSGAKRDADTKAKG